MLNEATHKLTLIKDQYIAKGTLNPKALTSNPAILTYQVPGGMLSNLMSQLKDQNAMHEYEEVLKEIPVVRKDLGYPPLVTPLSQMVGTQALMNVLTGERYKIVPKEIKAYFKGQYGAAPYKVNKLVRDKIIGTEETIKHRPADDLAPEFEALKETHKDLIKCDEDVLSIALFETMAIDFLKQKYDKKPKEVLKENPKTYAFSVVIGGD